MFHIEHGIEMNKRVNLADRKKVMELLTGLYGESHETTITKEGESGIREKRATSSDRVGIIPQDPSGTSCKRRQEK